MATVKLKIRNDLVKKNGSQTETTIYCQYCFDGKIRLFNTGVKTLPEFWDEATCQVRKSTNYTTKNATINKVKVSLESIIQHAEYNHIPPTLDYVERTFQATQQPIAEPVRRKYSFLEYFDMFIKSREDSKEFARTTINCNKSVRGHLEKFITTIKYELTFDTADLKFYEQYKLFLRNENLRDNSIGAIIKQIKTFLGWAMIEGYHSNKAFENFKRPSEEIRAVFITDEELKQITELDLSQNPRLDRVRDSFLFQCFTGLRYGDLEKIKPSDFKGEFIHVRTQKTGTELNIPLLPEVIPILEKYNYDLPRISLQNQNNYLKEIATLAKITDTINRVKVEKGKKTIETVSKDNLLSTHAARRYFVTRAIKKGIPAAVIMMVTGHKDFRTLQKYIKLVSTDVKEAFAKGFK